MAAAVSFEPGLSNSELAEVEHDYGFQFPPDLRYYGTDLTDYFANEFSYHFGRSGYILPAPVRRIEFWSDLIER